MSGVVGPTTTRRSSMAQKRSSSTVKRPSSENGSAANGAQAKPTSPTNL